LKKWREELLQLMAESGYDRTPALRRSRKSDYLFATDYPCAAGSSCVAHFLNTAGKNGWHAAIEKDWIHLDREPVFEAADEPPAQTPEAVCCLSLLQREREKSPSDGSAERMILKALEEGTDAYEKTCATLHARWAAMLRQKQPLPDVDKRFFGGIEK